MQWQTILLWIFLVGALMALWFFAKRRQTLKNNDASTKNDDSTADFIPNETVNANYNNNNGQIQDKVVEEAGYYRKQSVNQKVIKRTPEQQKIFEEYFCVKNYRTRTCDSKLYKKAKAVKNGATALLVVGIVLSVIGILARTSWLIVVGVLSLIGSIVCFIVSNFYQKKFEATKKETIAPKKLMTDKEFEALVEEKIENMNIQQMGLDKLGLDIDQIKEIRPIVLSDKIRIKDQSLIVYSKVDNSTHSSTQYVTYLYFTDEQLFVYKIVFDMCCNIQDEYTSEFFYKDICDVSSHTYKNILKGDGFEFEYSTIAFKIIASNSSIGFEMTGDNDKVDSIQAMKQKIRDKRNQTV